MISILNESTSAHHTIHHTPYYPVHTILSIVAISWLIHRINYICMITFLCLFHTLELAVGEHYNYLCNSDWSAGRQPPCNVFITALHIMAESLGLWGMNNPSFTGHWMCNIIAIFLQFLWRWVYSFVSISTTGIAWNHIIGQKQWLTCHSRYVLAVNINIIVVVLA